MANYTGTDWQPETKISTDIMATIDEGLGELNADLTDKLGMLKSIKCSSLNSGGSVNIEYSMVCLIFVARASATTNFFGWLCDQWSGVVEMSSNTNLYTVTASNKVATLTNSSNSYCNYLAFVL